MHLVKHLKGHSGANVSLYDDKGTYKVIKSNYKNSIESANILNALPFSTPEILEVSDNKIIMEYVEGQDMKTYLESADTNDVNKLIAFLESYINWSLENSHDYIFTTEVKNKINQLKPFIDLTNISTSLMNTKPKSLIHGDFTLENIIFANNRFYFIDANPTDLNSIHFDANKLRQDIDCLWFVRNAKYKLNYGIVCSKISNELKSKFDFMNDNNTLIFMLSRILPYCTEQSTTNFLMKEINKRWQ